MRRVLKSIFALAVFTIISVSFALFLKDQYPEVLGAGPVLKVNQGGTGATSFTSGECLKGNGTGAVTTGSCGSGTGTETDPIWIASSTNYYTKALSDGRYDVLGQATSSLTSHTSSFNHANYNTAYGWGNHASSSYIKTEEVKRFYKTPTYSHSLDSGWTSDDANQVHDSSVYFGGVGSVRIDNQGDALAKGMSTTTNSLDLTAMNFKVWIRSDDWSGVDTAQIRLYTDASNFFYIPITQFFQDLKDNEWYDIILTRQKFITFGSPDWTDINEIEFRSWDDNTGTPSIWFDEFTVFEQAQKGVISISFDDGWDSGYSEGAKYMFTKGLSGTFYIIPELLGTAGRMTQSDIDDLAKKGFDISGHNNTDLTSLSESVAEEEVLATANYLRTKNYQGKSAYAYPNGQNNEAIRNIVSKYFTLGRTINYVNQSLSEVNNMRLNSLSPINTWTVNDIKAYIDSANQNNEWLNLTFHKLVVSPSISTEYSITSFREVIDYIISLGVDVMPVSQITNMSWDSGSSGAGNVVGPASATNNALVRYDSTTGKLLKNSTVTLGDTGALTGILTLDMTGNLTIDGATNAFAILDRNTSTNFAAFQFMTGGVKKATIGLYNTSQDDLYIQLDGADAGRRKMITFDQNRETIFNGDNGNHDFRVAGDNNTHLIFGDAGLDNVGIGTSTPGFKLDVAGDSRIYGKLTVTGSTTIQNLTASNCDVKADGTGGLYCGLDANGLTGITGQLAYFSGTDTAVGTSSISIDASGLISFTQTPFVATTSRKLLDEQTYFTDLLYNNAATFAPYLGVAVSSGAVIADNGGVNNPGVVALRDSATVGGGYAISTAANAINLRGGEKFECNFYIHAKTSRKIKMGFLDSLTHADPTDGVWLEYDYSASSTAMFGRTANSNTRSTSTTAYTFNAAAWYAVTIEVTSDNSVTFSIYNDNRSLLLWTETMTTNIPDASDFTGAGVHAYEVTTSAAANLASFDYIRTTINRRLYR